MAKNKFGHVLVALTIGIFILALASVVGTILETHRETQDDVENQEVVEESNDNESSDAFAEFTNEEFGLSFSYPQNVTIDRYMSDEPTSHQLSINGTPFLAVGKYTGPDEIGRGADWTDTVRFLQGQQMIDNFCNAPVDLVGSPIDPSIKDNHISDCQILTNDYGVRYVKFFESGLDFQPADVKTLKYYFFNPSSQELSNIVMVAPSNDLEQLFDQIADTLRFVE